MESVGFFVIVPGKDSLSAFNSATTYDKNEYRALSIFNGIPLSSLNREEKLTYAELLLHSSKHIEGYSWIVDTDGPAACVSLGPSEKHDDLIDYLFFGWSVD